MADQQISIKIDAHIAEFASKMAKAQSLMQKFQNSASRIGKQAGQSLQAGMSGMSIGQMGNLDEQSAIIDRLRGQAQELSAAAQPISDSLFSGKSFDSPKQFEGMSAVLQTQAENIQSTQKDWDNYFNNLDARGRRGGPLTGHLTNTNQQVQKLGETTSQAGNDMMEAFDGAAMGLLFFGMQVRRIFSGIIRSGVSTFQDVHSQLENTTTQTDRLSGAWQFLKFNIGEAMQPLMGFLTPIVDDIAQFVDNNQGLAQSFLTIGSAVGALMLGSGSVQLGLKALSSALTSGGFLYNAFTGFNTASDALRGAFTEAGTGPIDRLKGSLDDVDGAVQDAKDQLKGLGNMAAIAIAVESFDQAFEEFGEGDLVDGILTATSTAASTAAFILPGAKAKGTALAIAVGLRILAIDSVQRKLKEAAKFGVAAFQAAGEKIKAIIGQKAFEGLKQALIQTTFGLPVALQEVLGIAGIDVAEEIGDFDNTASDKSFSKLLDENLKEVEAEVKESEARDKRESERNKLLADIKDMMKTMNPVEVMNSLIEQGRVADLTEANRKLQKARSAANRYN